MIHLSLNYRTNTACRTPGEYLRYHRTLQGLTTRELADQVNVVPATIVLYENGTHPIKYANAVALAAALGIDRKLLLDEYTTFVDYPCQELLRKVRGELYLTQEQIAQEIGIAQTAYSGWERGARTPRRKEYGSIVAAFKKRKIDICQYIGLRTE